MVNKFEEPNMLAGTYLSQSQFPGKGMEAGPRLRRVRP
jgi:hypothetical protein